MTVENEYKILFTKLNDARKELEMEYEISFEHDPIENEQIRELAEICNQLDEQTLKEEFNSFTRS